MQLGGGTFLHGDCLELMAGLTDGSVDMVLCDLPYGTTACSWDSVIPFEPLWEQYRRVVKKNGAIVLTAAQPFTTSLISSQIDLLKHHWVWKKERGTGFQVAKYRPMMQTEDVCVFVNGKSRLDTYNPQMTPLEKPRKERFASTSSGSSPIHNMRDGERIVTERYPTNILEFPRDRGGTHPTQKPVALFEYLIRTYTNPGELVLDNTAGSGTTAIAAENSGRKWICMERDPDYYAAAVGRVYDHCAG